MDLIKFNDFQNICRTCMCTSDLINIQGNNIIDVLQFLSGARYSNNDELPQQLCAKCLRTMNEIQAFAYHCRQIHLTLYNCLVNFKYRQNALLYNKTINTEENRVEFIDIKQEVVNDQHQELVGENEVIKKLLYEQMMAKEEIKNKEQTITNYPNNTEEFITIKQEVIDDKNNEEIADDHIMKDESLFEQMVAKDEIENDEFTQDKNEELLMEPMVTIEVIENEESTIPTANEFNENSFENISNQYEANPLNINYEEVQKNTSTKTPVKENSEDRPFKCDVCSNSFKSGHGLKRHKIMHSDEHPYACDVCSKSFKTRQHLKQHKPLHSGERPYQCDVCNTSFKYSNGLRQHKTVHSDERRFECDICMKSFKHSAHLTRHKRIHSGERPYECDVCKKTFSQKSSLDSHMATHSDERRFECPVCLKGFKYAGDLIRHKKLHSDERERQLQCDVCSQIFKSPQILKNHKQFHSGERPFECNLCNHTFRTKINLWQHKKVHNRERRFECDVCFKDFKYSRNLIEHKRIHTGERPFECEVCSKAFTNKSHLVVHKTTHND